jgi:hypothetical protein
MVVPCAAFHIATPGQSQASSHPTGPVGQAGRIGQPGQMGTHVVVQIADHNGHTTAQETSARAAANPEPSLASLQAEHRTLTQRLERHWNASHFLHNHEIQPNDMTCAMIVLGGIGMGLLLASINRGSQDLIVPGSILLALGCALGGRDSLNCVRRGLHSRHLLEPQEKQELQQRRNDVDAAIKGLQAVQPPVPVAAPPVEVSTDLDDRELAELPGALANDPPPD